MANLGQRPVATRSRLQELEQGLGKRLDDTAKSLLRYRAVQGPARWLLNTGLAWSISTRIDRLRAKRLLWRIQQTGGIPGHVGIIMDGNRRFAEVLGLDRRMGHVVGRERLETVLDWCLELDIKVLTVYAFSTENLERPGPELELLMELFSKEFHAMAKDERVHRNRIRVRAIGNLELLPEEVRQAANEAMEATADYDGYTFNVAVAYGGRAEIVQAVQGIARDAAAGNLDPATITDATISGRLYTGGLPDPDFIIRTSGEERISNFLLWQLAYAELYFADVYWPGLSKLDFLKAIREFQLRQRRHGK